MAWATIDTLTETRRLARRRLAGVNGALALWNAHESWNRLPPEDRPTLVAPTMSRASLESLRDALVIVLDVLDTLLGESPSQRRN
jgi:hypothetical protein